MIKKLIKTVTSLILSLVILLLVAVGVLNLAKRAIYSEYYAIKSDVCINPGLDDGFVCQGIAAVDGEDKILVSGYMKDSAPSRIYVTDLNSKSYYVNLVKNGEDFDGHCGGIAVSNANAYLANGGKIYTIDLDVILNSNNGDFVEVGSGEKVNNNASFVFADDEYLYVGEFHDGGKYNVVGHEVNTAEGKHYAYCTKYALNDLNKPIKVYSIRNKVQGICFAPDGKIIMSTSYGLTDTIYYVYDESSASDSGLAVDGAPLYYLDKLEKEIKGPAMGEDLDYYNGGVITLTESASNKYIFGKFFGANKIVSLVF